jgi:DNA-binding MarR family transcriptional regulator
VAFDGHANIDKQLSTSDNRLSNAGVTLQHVADDPLTRLALLVFRAQLAISADGDRLAVRWRLTSAKWKVLGALALADQPLSAAQIGRRMGLSRQAALKQIDLLVAQRMLRRRTDPLDARAPVHELSAQGRGAYDALTRAWMQRSAELSAPFARDEIEQAANVLARLVDRVEIDPRAPRRPPPGRG